MGVAMKQFIDRFKAMEKIANETLAENPEALVGVDSLPGSEHDAKVPEEAKKPDEEVAQGQPAGAASTAGAVNGGDAKPLNEGKLEIDQPLLNPEQKPLITDDALTAKTANAHLASLVSDILKDINAGTEKKAAAVEQKPMTQAKEEKVASGRNEIRLDEDTISKIAAAQAVFAAGRKAAESAVKQANAAQTTDLSPSAAKKLIKDACVKAAQEQGLDPASAAMAADNAMATAGMAPEEAAAADAGAAEAAAADAGAEAAAGGDAGIPEDVTEEELATAIVDLVSSGELDPNTAKALVEEIAGDEAGAGPSEDEAAEIIAQGLESGEITPEQAQEIAAAIEGEGAADAGAEDAGAEAEGAAAAEQAMQDAQDEAKGAADADAAIKSAAAAVRQGALAKVAGAIVSKRAEKQASAAPAPGQRILAKVAGVLEARAAQQKAQKAQTPQDEFIEGFRKKAEAMGVDPKALAKYVCDRQAK